MEISSATFLARVAERILSDHPGSMHNTCVVVPNRRAGLYLKHHLGSNLKKPEFAPSVFAIEDFVFSLLDLKQADQLILLWELFDCYESQAGVEPQPFEEFLKWGKVLLQDFEDIDMYLADASDVFSYLSEAKALELWNPGKEHLTAGQQKYLSFYRSLAGLYQRFTQRLLDTRSGYKGLAFRTLASGLAGCIAKHRWTHFYFVGFNALTPAEQKILDGLELERHVIRLYDADSYYIDDSAQEAGVYLREIIRNTGQGKFEWLNDHLRNTAKNITVIGVPQDAAQALVAGSLLSEVEASKFDDTAVVLNEEKLLLPLLNSLPSTLDHFNVTMGYPFSLTPAYGLLETILQLHLHAYERIWKNKQDEQTGRLFRFHFRDVLSLLKHPYTSAYLAGCYPGGDNPVQSILNEGRVFYTRDEILSPFSGNQASLELLNPVFNHMPDAKTIIDTLIKITQVFVAAPDEDTEETGTRMDHEYLYQLSLILNRLSLLSEKAGDKLSLRGLYQLIRSVAGSASIPFSGEPLKGVQIMGMLETRALDFKNVIMLSVSEGILPVGKHQHTFIPFDIRRNYDLPVYSDRDAVFAYHFYRLLQRCENLFLIYNTTPGELGGGEKSRFILQLEHELIKCNPDIRYTEKLYSPPIATNHITKDIFINKSPDVMEVLMALSKSGFSPTALSTYVTCPLKFYFSYVVGIDEESTVDDTMDASVFGTGIHNALHDLYSPYTGKALSVKDVENISGLAAGVLRRSFLEAFNNNEIDYGRNLLMVKVAESFLQRFFRFERESIASHEAENGSLHLLHLEYPMGKSKEVTINIELDGLGRIPVRLKGKADRIDSTGGAIRIIDYKTGLVKTKDLTIEDWDELIGDGDKTKALQLMIYSYLYTTEFSGLVPESGIISFRNLNQGFMRLELPEGPGSQKDAIETILQKLLTDIYNPSLPFGQTDELKHCEYCPFAGVCRR